jgi:hypothetical protein
MPKKRFGTQSYNIGGSQFDSGLESLLRFAKSHIHMRSPYIRSMHRVYMYFMLRDGWGCQFLEADLKTPLHRKLTFDDVNKVREMHTRFGVDQKLEDKSAIEFAVKMGRGSMWLNLTDDQYAKLKRRR